MKTIVYDFDGVIHLGYKGWKDGSIYGKLNYELLALIKRMLKTNYIAISSCRPAQQIVDFMNDKDPYDNKYELMEGAFWNKPGVIGVTNMKAVGVITIDDRVFCYHEGCNETMLTAISKAANLTVKELKGL